VLMVFSIPKNNQSEKKFYPAYWVISAELRRAAHPRSGRPKFLRMGN
jgi:hypothetical protein